MMRACKRAFGLLLGLCLFLSVTAAAQAAEEETGGENAAGAAGGSYSYTVTLSAGGKGSFQVGESAESTIEISGVSYDRSESSRISLTSYMRQVVVEDERYYVKGFHLSGKEDLEGSVPRTEDAVYVVSYGIRGNVVRYVVNYQDAAGNTLAQSDEFYGNVGDKPVVAFLYIDGYQPQAYNLTKTLVENEAENVFTFVYTPIGTAPAPAPAPEEPTTEAPSEAADAPAPAPAPAPEPAPAPDDPGVVIEDEEVPQGGPEEIIDLDDPDVPLANPDGEKKDDEGGAFTIISDAVLPLANLPGVVKGVFAAGVLALLAGLFFFLFKRKKKKQKVENTQNEKE